MEHRPPVAERQADVGRRRLMERVQSPVRIMKFLRRARSSKCLPRENCGADEAAVNVMRVAGRGFGVGGAVLSGYEGDCERCGGTGACPACGGSGETEVKNPKN
jgi:hypothetical protein